MRRVLREKIPKFMSSYARMKAKGLENATFSCMNFRRLLLKPLNTFEMYKDKFMCGSLKKMNRVRSKERVYTVSVYMCVHSPKGFFIKRQGNNEKIQKDVSCCDSLLPFKTNFFFSCLTIIRTSTQHITQ